MTLWPLARRTSDELPWTTADVRTREAWKRIEYDRLVEAEILGPEDRIELLGGRP